MDDSRIDRTEEPSRQVRALRLVDPGRRELRTLVQRLGVPDALVRQVQDLSLAPGFVELEEQLLLRLNLPSAQPDEPLEWARLDVLVGAAHVITVEPRSLEGLERAWETFPRLDAPLPRSRLLSALLGAVVESFARTLEEIRLEVESLRELGMISAAAGGGPSEVAREQLRGLARGGEQEREVLAGLAKRDAPPMDPATAAELRAHHDKLAKLSDEANALGEQLDQSIAEAQNREAELGAESPEIIDVATAIGKRRLHRVSFAHGVTALIGGMAVSFGAMAMGWTAGPWLTSWGYERAQLLSALAFPIGFLILIVGKGELFTENFFVPVTGVISGQGKVTDLLLLWGFTLAFNLLGGLVFALLASRPEVMVDGAQDFLIQLAQKKMELSFGAAFIKAVFAGWLMTLMTWLLLAARGSGTRVVILWSVGFLLVAGHFNHVVISASEIFLAMGLGAPITAAQWFSDNFLPALLGNLVGGLFFVTLLGYMQAHTLRQGEERLKREARK
jgi:formate/nitrite transporter FocA (FNT family)/Mg2+ and Co2+ transporter CorA